MLLTHWTNTKIRETPKSWDPKIKYKSIMSVPVLRTVCRVSVGVLRPKTKSALKALVVANASKSKTSPSKPPSITLKAISTLPIKTPQTNLRYLIRIQTKCNSNPPNPFIVIVKIRNAWNLTVNASKTVNFVLKNVDANHAKISTTVKKGMRLSKQLNKTDLLIAHAKRQSVTKSTVLVTLKESSVENTVLVKTAPTVTKLMKWIWKFMRGKMSKIWKMRKCRREWVSSR